jgi:hypothetical protein
VLKIGYLILLLPYQIKTDDNVKIKENKNFYKPWSEDSLCIILNLENLPRRTSTDSDWLSKNWITNGLQRLFICR